MSSNLCNFVIFYTVLLEGFTINIKTCIFCECDSSTSNSVEHIIPESLGNDEFILEKGIVCDKCNNYFSRKIEGPVLNSEIFSSVRFYYQIPSKKKKLSSSSVIIANEKTELKWVNNKNSDMIISISPQTLLTIFEKKSCKIYTPKFNLDYIDDKYIFSRFISKICVEFYTYVVIEYYSDENVDSINIDPSLKPLINYTRYGNRHKTPWSYKVDKIHEINPFKDDEYVISFDLYLLNDQVIFKLRLFNYYIHINPANINHIWN